jgi:gliding motility-associated-like protein
MRTLLTLLFISFLCTGARAQNSEGDDFWFTFLEHRDPNNVKVALISAREPTSGTISIPGTGFSETFTVAANTVAQVELPVGAETRGSESVTASAVHIESQGVVSVYIHQYFNRRSEASLVLPTPVLGTEYYVLGYSGRVNNQNFPSTFAVVATEDETLVEIDNLTAATEGGRTAGSSIQVMLNQGQVYQVRAADGALDLTGTRVTSSLPVALYSGAAWSGVPADGCAAFDNLLEINYPVSQWGLNYLGVPTFNNATNLYRIIASEDNTSVTLSGDAPISFQLDAGEFRDFELKGAVGIESSRPVLVSQYLLGRDCNGHPNGLGDPSFFLLNELTQSKDTVTVYNSNLENITENYLNITFRAGDEVGIKLDGAPLPGPIESSPDGEYSYARVRVNTGSHTVSSTGCGVIVTAYGYGEIESYAYGGGAAFRDINANPIAEGGCLNDTVFFATGLDPLRFRHEWTLEDGSVETRPDFPRFYGQLGEFPVRLIIEDLCLGSLDTSFRDVAITLRQAVTASPDVRVCAGETVELEAFDLAGARYEWAGPNGFEETTQQISLPETRPEDTGIYEVVGNINGCKTFPTEVLVMVDATPVVDITGGGSFCGRQGESSLLDAGDYAAYEWSTGARSNPLSVITEGNYTVTVTDENGCVASDSIFVEEFCPTRFYIPSAFSPNADGINDRFGVSAVDFTSVQLQVYDRWGGLVFSSTPAVPEWDGRVNGQAAAVGTYLYSAAVEGTGDDGTAQTRVQSGVVMLVR